ncbi:FecR protein [Rosistilla ulvae]|uniref:FecR protein n=1 Tax=Rosistilla ulvae TaxID=1930277 RepID=A0A517M345_9BACT|nr:DNRLRE domain-containing protein [Rosistilla ulvae]QDS89293.1 FecR protein [Rosistilla ulvae]
MTDDPDDLISGYLDGTLTKPQLAELGEWIEAAPANARRFADASLVDNLMQAKITAAPWIDALEEPSDDNSPTAKQKTIATRSGDRRRWKLHAAYATALSVMAFFGWWTSTWNAASQHNEIAAISTATDCKWGAGTLPTAVGSRLQPGRLELVEGFAKLSFDNGVELSLEAPIDISLHSPTLCEVHSGQLIANVPGAEIQFVVETATTEILDLGTEFAVRVERYGNTGVQVLSGKVDVTNRASGESRRLIQQQTVHVGADSISATDTGPEMSLVKSVRKNAPVAPATNTFLISTAQGRGRDAFVFRKQTSDYTSPELLLVKHCLPRLSDWDRKVYLALDVASLQGLDIEQAELRLNLLPSDLGFASHQPDSTFHLFGLIDESRDDWDEQTITWENAPGQDPRAAAVDPTAAIALGSFEVRQGIQTGTVSVRTEQLKDFIAADTNGAVTLIVVRETQESTGNGLVHAFASKEHPSGLPPMLRVVCRSPQSSSN